MIVRLDELSTQGAITRVRFISNDNNIARPINIAPSSPQQPIKQNNTKPNISLPPKTKQKTKSTLTKNSKQNNFFPSNISL